MSIQPQDIAALAARVKENISRVIIGKSDLIELLLAAVIARGHILMEDVPGTGKTVMALSLAKSLTCEFARIQFTPDLLPSDVVGTSVYRQSSGTFEFHKGPVFTNLLLADEINRATPRTQSALLECMQERQVTEGGVTHPLPEPFMVLATQNPIEIQGTFPLPEAQLDRFLMRLTPGYPDTASALQILSRFLTDEPLHSLQPVCQKEALLEAQAAFNTCEVSLPVQQYIVALCERTRQDERILLGVSPRGMLALMRAAQAYAMVKGRAFVTPDDVQLLVLPVLSHRIVPRGFYGKSGVTDAILTEIMRAVPVPTEER